MNIIRFSKPAGYPTLSERAMNQLFGEVNNEPYYFIPSANVAESKDNFKIELSVPGYSKELIGIQFHDNLLIIKGTIGEPEDSQEKYLSREFGVKSFIRRFTVPKTVDTEGITAAVSNGILTIIIPKREETKEKEPRDIRIN